VAQAGEAEAKQILMKMSDYISGEAKFAFDYDATLEIVTVDGQKLGFASSGAVAVERPEHLRATRTGGFADVVLSFDGKTATLLGKNVKRFAEIPAPDSIDELVHDLRDNHGLPLPAADLLMSKPYDEMMADVTDVKDMGSGVVDGRECDHLAFRATDVDWEIWVAQGEQPFPCRYVITSTSVASAPQYRIDIRDWRTGDAVAESEFAFSTDGAEKIDIEAIRAGLAELPPRVTKGASQ
jgi:hypothetical protein